MPPHARSAFLVPAAFAALLLGCSTAAAPAEPQSFGSQSAKSDGFEGTWRVTSVEDELLFQFESPRENYDIRWRNGGALIEVHGDEGVTSFALGPNPSVEGPAPEKAARRLGNFMHDVVAFLGEEDPEAESAIRDAIAGAASDPETSRAQMEALSDYLDERLGGGKADHGEGWTCTPALQVVRSMPGMAGVVVGCVVPGLGGALSWFIGAGDVDSLREWADNAACTWSQDQIKGVLNECSRL